ncbi:MAG TPA: DUF924 family protein [Burkholderiaceae bacterium]|nr:DUF924 family protein [Burkholderiaceae bacterium]
MDPAAVLSFWFGARDAASLHVRAEWFRKSDAFDADVRARFGGAIERALMRELESWASTEEGALALIVLLDQFTRNAFRDTRRAFDGDPQALEHARRLVYAGRDRAFAPIRRWFIYMPFEHSEDLVDQYESVRLFGVLADDGLPDPLSWAVRHFEVIRRFGRFPHRNEVLGRESTADELEFLQSPGSRF